MNRINSILPLRWWLDHNWMLDLGCRMLVRHAETRQQALEPLPSCLVDRRGRWQGLIRQSKAPAPPLAPAQRCRREWRFAGGGIFALVRARARPGHRSAPGGIGLATGYRAWGAGISLRYRR